MPVDPTQAYQVGLGIATATSQQSLANNAQLASLRQQKLYEDAAKKAESAANKYNTAFSNQQLQVSRTSAGGISGSGGGGGSISGGLSFNGKINEKIRRKMISSATQFNKNAYVWGAGHGGSLASRRRRGVFDCSGLVSYAMNSVGIKGIRVSGGWGSYGKRMARGAAGLNKLNAGDLVWHPGHIMIYLGRSKSGGYRVFEAKGRAYGIKYSTYGKGWARSQYGVKIRYKGE